MEYALITAAAIVALIVGLGLYFYWVPPRVKDSGSYNIRIVRKDCDPFADRMEFHCRSDKRPTPPSRIVFLDDAS